MAQARRFVYGTLLLVLGTSAGLLLGSIWEAPRLWLRAGLETIETVEVPAPEQDPGAPGAPTQAEEELPEFAYIQEPRPPVAAPSPGREEVVRPPTAEELIDRIRESRSAPEVPTPAQAPSTEPASVEPVEREVPPSGPVVQVAAYLERPPAEELVHSLRERGFDAYLSKNRSGVQRRFRVRVVPATGEDSQTLALRLGALGYETWTTRE